MDTKIKEAIQNITVVVANAKMTRDEHIRLAQDIDLVTKTCEGLMGEKEDKKDG